MLQYQRNEEYIIVDSMRLGQGTGELWWHPSVLASSVNLRQQALSRNHNLPTAGHQGPDKTLQRLRHETYWVGMAQDVERQFLLC